METGEEVKKRLHVVLEEGQQKYDLLDDLAEYANLCARKFIPEKRDSLGVLRLHDFMKEILRYKDKTMDMQSSEQLQTKTKEAYVPLSRMVVSGRHL